jgi:DNA-binding IclR family transcriptional regulator
MTLPVRPALGQPHHQPRSGNAVSKALRILEEAARTGEPRQLAEIAADAGVLKPSTHRILASLAELGYVTTLGGGSYTAGPRMRALAAEVVRERADLARVRDLGYAMDDEENETTIRCLGAPVLDANGYPVGAVSVSTVIFLLPREELLGHAPALMATARRIGALLN